MNTRSQSVQTVICLAVIVVLGFVSYANVLNGEFIWDDVYLIRDNPFVHSWTELPNVFTKDIGAGVGHAFNFYRPLQMVTYLVDHSLWPSDVRGFHFSSVLYHILAAWAVLALLLVLYKDLLIAFLAGACFVVHPIHTEAVAYLSGRADPLAALFILLTILFYARGLETQKPKWFAGVVCFYLLALLSRESALILPALLFLYQYSFRKKTARTTMAVLFGMSLFYVLLRKTVFDFSIAGNIPETTFLQRLPGFFVAVFNYTRLMIFPFGLHMEYGNPLFTFKDPRAIAGIMIVAVVLALMIERRKQRGPVFFGLSWFVLGLLPVSNLYPINAYMAEHWLYLPSIGLFLIAAGGIVHVLKRNAYRPALWTVIAAVLAGWCALTMLQNRHWQNETAFYEHTIKHAADSPRMINGLALAYHADGRTAAAIRVYERAIQQFPDEAFYRSNLGALYLAAGKVDIAKEMFRQTLEIDPTFENAHKNLALIRARQKEKK